ncbi:hypothetical protein J3R82DRAFT_40 [Butyriboletus roseoflavus]|nr:hypothetical protein J3R82DRAFT_40 [Butyriboletus roseoflavus]
MLQSWLALESAHSRVGQKKMVASTTSKFYYITMDLIDECEDIEWKEGLLKHFNMLFFKNEEGWGGDLKAMDDYSAPASTKKGGFLSSEQQLPP